jgi:chromosome segregation ATPase
MRSRSLPPVPAPAHGDVDPDSTAELPVLDPAGASTAGASTSTTVSTEALAGEAADQQQTTTDNWELSPTARAALGAAAARAEKRLDQEAELRTRTAALQEAQERLASHSKRLLQLEQARDEALAAQAAAAQRAATAEQRATQAEQRATQAEQQATHAEKRSAGFEQRIAELEQKAARLSAELAERRSVGAQQAGREQEWANTLAAAEKRAASAAEELAQARAMVSAAGARAQQLQQRLEQHESDTRARHMRELEQQQAQAAAGRAHAAGVMEDLHNERARAMSYLESLQTLERRRELAQELVTDLHREAEARAAQLARLTQELTGRDERARLQEGELAQRAGRIAQLEQHTSTLTTMLTQRDTELRAAREDAQGLRASIARLQAETNARAARLQELEAHAAQREHTDTQQLIELQQLRSAVAALEAEREEARRSAQRAASQASAHQAELTQRRERVTQLESSLEVERQRTQQLEAELAAVRGEMEDWGGVLRAAQQERASQLASVAAAEARVRELEQQASARGESVRALQAESAAHLARIRELESDLHVAEEALHRLEADARGRSSRIAELERSNQQWRETAAETRQAATDTNLALGDPRDAAREEGVAAEPPDGATRLLIHSEDGREVVHVLGRKTSIGRTPDNDLQLEAKFISRHHAVILVGPVNTVIEDLNSTNGVQVNGRRITRQTLRDGDQIAIGRVHYRFAVRKPADKR